MSSYQGQSSEALAALAESVGDVLFVASFGGPGRGLELISPAYERVWGRTVASALAQPSSVLRAVHPDDQQEVLRMLASMQGREWQRRELEVRVLRPAGDVRWVWVRCFPVEAEGAAQRVAGIATDITERRMSEDALEATADGLEHALRVRRASFQVLLRELHHRVKNSLQLVTSLLYLQARSATQAETRSALTATRSRIRSLALLYEPLYRTGDLRSVDMQRYLNDLASPIGHPLAESNPGVRLEATIEPVQLGLDQAITCGLLVNELLTNAYAHAFPQREGRVRVSLTRHEDELELKVTDEGIGIPLVLPDAADQKLGLRLVRRLVAQLDGRLEVQRRGGTELIVRFPVAPR